MAELTPQVRLHLREALVQRRDALYRDIARERALAEPYGRHAGEAPDAGDASLADLIADLDHAAVGRDVRELREIGAALQRLQAGGYGVCADCGQPIPVARLEAQPAAARCASCQDTYERTHAGQGPGPTL